MTINRIKNVRKMTFCISFIWLFLTFEFFKTIFSFLNPKRIKIEKILKPKNINYHKKKYKKCCKNIKIYLVFLKIISKILKIISKILKIILSLQAI